MLSKNIQARDTRSEHKIKVSTLYKYVTVFNHSDHAITFYPENLVSDSVKMYRVPPRIYLTLPLVNAGRVESCTREVAYTVVTEGVQVQPTSIMLFFTEENSNINMPFPDISVVPINVTVTQPTSGSDVVAVHNVSVPLANTEYFFDLPVGTKKFNMSVQGVDNTTIYRIAFQGGRVGTPLTRPYLQLTGTQVYYSHSINLSQPLRIFFSTTTTNNFMQIEVWR